MNPRLERPTGHDDGEPSAEHGMRNRGFPSLLYAAALAVSLPATAQTTGGMAGQVVDAQTQSPLKDAVVIASSPSLQGEQTAVSDDKGQFEITLLPSGVYTINVQREGYQPFSQQGLKVSLDRTIRVKLQIMPDAFQEKEVVITAERPRLDVKSTVAGSTVSKEQMEYIPYGRNA